MRLQELLEQGVRYDPHYLPSMNSDHLPMTLCAMQGLGATDSLLQQFEAEYRLRLRRVSSNLLSAGWRGAVGNPGEYLGLMHYLRAQIDQTSINEVVKEFLPEFLSGLALDAFHPIIRLGYAIDFESASETAAALAYLITSYREVPFSQQHIIDLPVALAQQVDAGSQPFNQARFSQRMTELIDVLGYPVGTASFEVCANCALEIYMGTRDFFALHMVTATQAARICARLVDPQLAMTCLTGAILAAHKAVGSPDFAEPKPLNSSLDPEHSLKYAWACLSEFGAYGDPRYLDEVQAFRDRGLIPAWCAIT
jgi:hypothetical protein